MLALAQSCEVLSRKDHLLYLDCKDNHCESGCGVDFPGSFMAWLSTQTVVHAMEMPGKRYDIGNLESYQAVQKIYKAE